jgi:tetratricopeptide (TPR) repeat protein
MPAQALSIWLLFAVVTAGALIYTGVKVNLDRARQPVEGSNDDQQKRADDLRQALERDSTNVDAHVGLGNLLYDTGNWAEAIVHYRAALRRDSTRTGVIVDLGVCYYNLGQGDEAEKLFRLAVQRDPHQPVALFNLGIVSERRSEFDAALQFYHRALESSPPEEMKPILVSAMQRVQEKTGRKPKPLPTGGDVARPPHAAGRRPSAWSAARVLGAAPLGVATAPARKRTRSCGVSMSSSGSSSATRSDAAEARASVSAHTEAVPQAIPSNNDGRGRASPIR